ncbi:solute carrier family 35 member F5 [Sarcoptes scabiei]|nr:solute carrier family 35 member F5 [Sarcoptes scabiei]
MTILRFLISNDVILLGNLDPISLLNSLTMLQIPIGIRLFLKDQYRSLVVYRFLVLILTYLAYASYHLSRRSFSIVKNVLSPHCSNATDKSNVTSFTDLDCNGWSPFNRGDSETLFSFLDSVFLFAYAFGMFFSGFIAERCNLRYFLAMGMLLSGVLNYCLGLAFYYNIHSLWFFVIFQLLSGLMQTTGWPAVVCCIGNWVPKSSRGVLFGFWNSHTNVGNILGAIIAGAFVDYNWGLSFIVPGIIIAIVGFLLFLFLVPCPEDVGISSSDIHSEIRPAINEEDSPLLRSNDYSINFNNTERHAISFYHALWIPGVLEFSFCLFFAKLVSYTFLFWLPFYIKYSVHISSSDSAYLSASFDLGGIIGAIMAGYIVDRYGYSALTCVGMLTMAIPSLLCYYNFGATSNLLNILLQVISGAFVNGPYSLITTTVSTELGTKVKSSQALATVTAIIDGTGSFGAAIGPLLSGPLAVYGWKYVFLMVILSDAVAMLSLIRIAKQEFQRYRRA